jgi:hypothetical protein
MKIPLLKTYDDGRKSIEKIYSSFNKLVEKGWMIDTVGFSEGVYMNKKVCLPMIALRTAKAGKSIWILSGIHGEEPAGPNALSEPASIEFMLKLGKNIPLVLLPLCNPLGYTRNWRYVNQEEWSEYSEGQSVGDSEHYLKGLKDPHFPRRAGPICKEAEFLTRYVVENSRKYKPLMSFDFHEDNLLSKGYVYSQGKYGQEDSVAKGIVRTLMKSGVEIQKNGETRFGEKIINGVVGNEQPDGSIDELLVTKEIIVNHNLYDKPAARTSVVIETPAKAMSLDKRRGAHMDVLFSLEKYI